jgi:hypothetical protein
MTRHNHFYMRSTATLTLMLVLALLSVGRTAAEDQSVPQLGIRPVDVAGSYFDLTLEPGTVRELSVELENHGTGPAQARTYVANVSSLVNGGMDVGAEGDPISGATAWITYPSEVFSLEPRTAQRRSLTLRVPNDAQPGEYMASIVLQAADGTPTSGAGGLVLTQVVRHAITVAVTVPGAKRPELTIISASHHIVAGKSMISVELRNSGNVRLQPFGNLILKDAAGNEVSRYPVKMDTIFAGTTTSFEVPFAGVIALGDYMIALDIADPTAGVQVSMPALPVAVQPTAQPTVPAAVADAGPGVAPINQVPVSQTPGIQAPVPTPASGIAIPPDVLFVAGLAFIILLACLPMLRRRRR